eukprot:UN08012
MEEFDIVARVTLNVVYPPASAMILAAAQSFYVPMPYLSSMSLSQQSVGVAMYTLRPVVDIKMSPLDTFYLPTVTGLDASFLSTLIGEYTQTDHLGYLVVSIDGTKLYPGDIVVLKFVPDYSTNTPTDNNIDEEQQPYRLYTP